MKNILVDMVRVAGQEVALAFGDLVKQDGLPLDFRHHEKATTRVPGTVQAPMRFGGFQTMNVDYPGLHATAMM